MSEKDVLETVVDKLEKDLKGRRLICNMHNWTAIDSLLVHWPRSIMIEQVVEDSRLSTQNVAMDLERCLVLRNHNDVASSVPIGRTLVDRLGF